VQYTKVSYPKPSADAVVHSWVLDSWRRVNHSNTKNSKFSVGFSNDFKQWHIADVYGNDLQLIPQYDELKYEKKLHNLTFKHYVHTCSDVDICPKDMEDPFHERMGMKKLSNLNLS
jgi:hypothetical protein